MSTIPTPKKDTLKKISQDLRNIDFSNFDPRKDKAILMTEMQKVQAKLGKLLRGIENATT